MTLSLAFALNIFKTSLVLGKLKYKLRQENNHNKKTTHIYKKSKIKATLGLEKERLDGKAKSNR